MTPKLALLLTWVALVSGFVSYATAQFIGSPGAVNGCVVTTTASPGYTANQRVAFSCNTAGQLRVTTTP